jgi:hypothetical protein
MNAHATPATWERPIIEKVPLVNVTQASVNRGNDGTVPAPTAS